ncbi:Uncharacterised protein [uncultured archaeon]|nr:Uncharacterised protein [uncultured archaeon]
MVVFVMSENNNIFKKEIIKDILGCFFKTEETQLRFSEIKKRLPKINRTSEKAKKTPLRFSDTIKKRPKYFDMQINRALNEMLSFGIFNKNGVYYQLTDKYMVEVRQSQLSRLIDSYSPKDVMDFSKTVLLGLPDEVYRPDKKEIASEYFYDLHITPEDIFKDDSDFTKRVKERIIKFIDDNCKNKTKEELIEELKINAINQTTFKQSIPPYEACECIVRKLVEGRDKHRLLFIQSEYDSQLTQIIDNGFKRYMGDYREYYTQKLNIFFMHFFKTGRHSGIDRYEDFENKDDFEYTLYLFYTVDDDKLPMDIARPSSESIVRWSIEILKFLSKIVQNVNEQTNDRYVTPITIVSTSFRAVFADEEFWKTDEKIRKIIKHQQFMT